MGGRTGQIMSDKDRFPISSTWPRQSTTESIRHAMVKELRRFHWGGTQEMLSVLGCWDTCVYGALSFYMVCNRYTAFADVLADEHLVTNYKCAQPLVITKQLLPINESNSPQGVTIYFDGDLLIVYYRTLLSWATCITLNKSFNQRVGRHLLINTH